MGVFDEEPDDQESQLKIPAGRLQRLTRVAGLGASLATQAAAKVISRGKETAAHGDSIISIEQAEKIVSTLGEMKGVAMKLGQQLSMEVDHMPPEIRAVMGRLYNQAPVMEPGMIIGQLENQLGQPPDKLFAGFDMKPWAAASLGQVHRAHTHDGTPVAVKIQYPGVDEALSNDLKNIGMMVKSISAIARQADGVEYFNEVNRELHHELDYLREARSADLMGKAFALFPDLHAPRVFRELSCQRVLTTEFIEGQTLRQFVESNPSMEERVRVSHQLIRATYGPFMSAGLIHADPHPGNYLIRPDGGITIIDFGNVRMFRREFIEAYRRMILDDISESPRLRTLPELIKGGFRIIGEENRQTADEICEDIRIIFRRQVSGPYDYSRCTMIPEVRQYIRKRKFEFIHFRPPADATFFYRAAGGLMQNLRLLGAADDFRPTFRQCCELEYRFLGEPA
ncbi:MAG: protein kinase UbiB [Myxococcota bacterium]|nr:protein kinase UbiB [Myxococcota bacterium]